jgi:hypothetical protein
MVTLVTTTDPMELPRPTVGVQRNMALPEHA